MEVEHALALRELEEGSLQHVLRSSIWKLIDGRWQMVFHQGTLSQAP